MHTKQQLLDLHAEHNEWQNKIRFFKNELRNFENELSEYIARESSHESLPVVEHFQNQFIMQREILDIMRHDFKQYENAIEHVQKHDVDTTVEGIGALQLNCKDRLTQFERFFHDLRHEFAGFINKNVVA